MLRLGRPVGAYPRLEARIAAIHLGNRNEEEVVEGTGCDECGDKGAVSEKACSDDASSDSDSDSDCGCVTGKEFEKNVFFDREWDTLNN